MPESNITPPLPSQEAVAERVADLGLQDREPSYGDSSGKGVNDPSSSSANCFSTVTTADTQSNEDKEERAMPVEEDETIFRSLQVIFEDAKREEVTFDVQLWLATLEQAIAERSCRVDRASTLLGIRKELEGLQKSEPKYMVRVTEILANGCRDSKWRVPYGLSGILDFYLALVARNDVGNDILLHGLRLIGNSCADVDENRDRALAQNYTRPIITLFENPAVTHVAIPVIYNICANYEPAQAQVAANGIIHTLVKLIRVRKIKGDVLLTYSYELVELASEQGVDESPDMTLQLMVRLASEPDISPEQFAYIVGAITAFLRTERFQEICIASLLVEQLVLLLRQSYAFNNEDLDEENQQTLIQLRLNLNQVLSDLSSRLAYAQAYPPWSQVTKILVSFLGCLEEQLQICSCVMLGNLARDDGICEAMIRDGVHLQLISILCNNNARAGVLHAAMGFLKNLAIATKNKDPIGASGVIKSVARLWAFETNPQVQLSAISLARQLVNSSTGNVGRFLEPLSLDPDSSEHSGTYISLLLSVFAKTDSVQLKVEIGRIMAAICREIIPTRAAPGASGIADTLSQRLFDLHKGVAQPLGSMVAQTEWPVVQSEGWFALALMASTTLGCHAVVDCLQSMDLYQMLCDVIRAGIPAHLEAKSTEDVTPDTKKTKDRENVFILVHELLTRKPPELADDRRADLEDLMREVGKA